MQTVILICIKQQNFSSVIPVTMLIMMLKVFSSVLKGKK
jgi:hypothetical protein